MSLRAVLLPATVLLLSALAEFEDMGITGCGDFTGNDWPGAMGLASAMMDPFSVQVGEPVTIRMNGTIQSTMNNATMKFCVRLGGSLLAPTCLYEAEICNLGIGTCTGDTTPSGTGWNIDDTYPMPSVLEGVFTTIKLWSNDLSGEVRFSDEGGEKDCWEFNVPIRLAPTATPTLQPTHDPGFNPTFEPTNQPTIKPTTLERHPDWQNNSEESNLMSTVLPLAIGAVFVVVAIILLLWLRQQKQKRAMAEVSKSNGLAKRLHEKHADLQRQARRASQRDMEVEMERQEGATATTTSGGGPPPPTHHVTFETRPLGFEVGFERIPKLGGPTLVITKVTDDGLGVARKFALVELNGEPLQGKKPPEMIQALKKAAFPFTIGFWDRSEVQTTDGATVGETI